tara:strand:+ start:24787 stop:25542 length:756 start_codon:yes stop_codon:yes gene_type:complete
MRENDKKKFLAQDNLYNFPYHYLPEKIGTEIIKPFRVHFWLYDYQLLHDYIAHKVESIKSTNILDFGCGDGKLINELKKNKSYKTCGYEISKKAAAFFKSFNPEIDLIQNEDELNRFENFFDTVIFSEVIEHIPDQEVNNVINKIYQCLKKNGYLIVSAPHKNLPVHKKHYRHYDFKKLLDNFDQKQFELIEKRFLFKSTILKKIVRKIFFNRFFIFNSNFLFKMYYKLNKIYFFSSEKKCDTVFLILKKK